MLLEDQHLSNCDLDLLNPTDIIEHMIDLRLQLAQLEQQVKELQPAFFAACLTFNRESIELKQATIKRRLTPGKWSYDPEITGQEHLLKALKRQFQNDHDPVSGRELIWIVKLLLTQT